MSDENKPCSRELVTGTHDEPNVKHVIYPVENRFTNYEAMINISGKSGKRFWVVSERLTTTEELLDDVLHNLLYNTQSSIRSFVYNVLCR